MASAPKRWLRAPFSTNSKGTERLDPLRVTALLFITAGVLLIVSFFYATSVAVEDQSRLDQSWRQHVVVPNTNPPKVDPALKHPVGGVDFAIQVPKLGYFAAVKEGVSTGVLYSGPGHYPETPWPGDMGTVGVAAHNVYWVNFPELKTGDEVDLQTRYGLYRYRVTGSRIVDPNDRTVLVPESGGYHLTLTTCWPLWAGAFATQRYVIFTDQFYPAPPPATAS
ncbi:MAG TPA: class D sortase [Candidatus Dormibacteraeota bacterium]|nr:class D sortase [Candidatus Dormibacteraeota bacterium]